MRRTSLSLIVMAVVFAGGSAVPSAAADKGKGTLVNLDGLQSKTPADWKEETPQGTFRLQQFSIPGGGELVLFKLGGGARANLERWKSQWVPPEGKKLEDTAVVKEIKIAGRPAQLLEIEGTYKTAPFDPKHKGKALSGYRMEAIYFEGPENAFQIKFYGPAKTVEKQKAAFEQWYKGFK